MLAEATALVEEVGRSLRAYAEAVEAHPARLVEVEERLELIRSLQRKYGDTIEAVLAYSAAAAEELDGLTRGTSAWSNWPRRQKAWQCSWAGTRHAYRGRGGGLPGSWQRRWPMSWPI